MKFSMKCNCGKNAILEIIESQTSVIPVDEYLTGAIFKCESCGKKYYTADWRECFALPQEEW